MAIRLYCTQKCIGSLDKTREQHQSMPFYIGKKVGKIINKKLYLLFTWCLGSLSQLYVLTFIIVHFGGRISPKIIKQMLLHNNYLHCD